MNFRTTFTSEMAWRRTSGPQHHSPYVFAVPRRRGDFFTSPIDMLPDLENLIQLQQLEHSASDTRDTIEGIPARLASLEVRVADRREEVSAATARLDEHRAQRRSLEKDLAEAQSQVSRYRDQLMAVKTNREYQAMQSEIAGGEAELQRLEDQLLERMLESDELSGEVTRAEQQLADDERLAETDRRSLEQERTKLAAVLDQIDSGRTDVADRLSPAIRSLFDTLSRERKGVAVVEASQGLCTSCQVRLRPQLFNDLRSNSSLIQCESCQRILYFAEHRHMMR